ncbi:hypothetical protein ACFC1T_09730 [Kitasatospora sp. NPDC056076]|uniref:hypothetical protein n=1 Tax=Kitasatospora sp. NPDC056076 TaxID=3345703 RepID=UPI0035E0C465
MTKNPRPVVQSSVAPAGTGPVLGALMNGAPVPAQHNGAPAAPETFKVDVLPQLSAIPTASVGKDGKITKEAVEALRTCERNIREGSNLGRRAFWVIAASARAIKGGNLNLVEKLSWEEYVPAHLGHLGISLRTINRYIVGLDVAEVLEGPIEEGKEYSLIESHARPLGDVLEVNGEDAVREVWDEAEKRGDGKVTAVLLTEIRDELGYGKQEGEAPRSRKSIERRPPAPRPRNERLEKRTEKLMELSGRTKKIQRRELVDNLLDLLTENDELLNLVAERMKVESED